MTLQILSSTPLAPFTTFSIGGSARFFAHIKDPLDIPSAIRFASEHQLSLLILGGGSNLIITDQPVDRLVLKIEILGITILSSTPQGVLVRIGAGVVWDHAVAWAVSHGLSGIEALSAIPGTAGATPVQNVGAYGQEIADTLASITAYDMAERKFVELPKEACEFGYRDSIFKHAAKGRYIITHVTLRLSQHAPAIPEYPGVRAYFTDHAIADPNLADIRRAIIDIRATKLPDPGLIPNVGSFFKNPIVSPDVFKKLHAAYPAMPYFSVEHGQNKLAAGWLVEQSGMKGRSFGSVATYDRNALVLTNTGAATYEDVHTAAQMIIETVREKFGITLEPEPEFIR